VILTPQDMTDPTATAECLRPYARIEGKPVLASWMGGVDVADGEAILNQAGIPTFPYPDTAASAFMYMWQSAQNLKAIYETPTLPTGGSADRKRARELIDGVRNSGRTILTEYESKAVLEAYGIPVVPTVIARSGDDAVKAADGMGYPIVLKLFSETITHKTDVGGVKLNLADAAAVKGAFDNIKKSVTEKAGAQHFQGVTVQPMIKLDGYEVILGASPDPQFGPVLLFGMGGQLVEVFKDRSLGLPPLTTTLARRMMEQTKIYKALKGVRGRKSVDLAALEQLMVRFSQLVVEQPLIKELDINPLLASPERLLALDARVVVYGKDETPTPDRPVIAPYPTQYVGTWKSKKGIDMTIRPIRPEDEPALVRFHEQLSETTVYRRYAEALQLSKRIAHERLTRICFIDYAREMAFVAEVGDEIAGVVRLDRLAGNEAEVSVVLSDKWQGQGLGTELMRRIVPIAKDLGLGRVAAEMLPDNHVMAHIFEKVGFRLKTDENGAKVFAELVP
jgi:acetyltransferase